MFRLTSEEAAALRSQSVISNAKPGRGGRRYMRTFVKIRYMLVSNEDLARKLVALENRYDAQFKVVFDAIRELMSPPVTRRTAIGFRPRRETESGGRLRKLDR